jgi:probable addiction module antidote protein
MLKRTRSYSEWRLEKLSDPVRAARYLNAAKKDSKEALLYALKNVIQANQVAKIAREAGISRESVYRSFSAEGNPTFDTLSDVLVALDIDYEFIPKEHSSSGPSPSPGAGKGKTMVIGHIGEVKIPAQNPGSETLIATVCGRTSASAGGAIIGSFTNIASPATPVFTPNFLSGTDQSSARSYGIRQQAA